MIEARSDAVKSIIAYWNVRSMNQGKLEVVKQEIAGVNADILGISELRWTGGVNLIQMTVISLWAGIP